MSFGTSWSTRRLLLVMRVRGGRTVRVRDRADALRGALELGRLPAVVDSLTAAR
jgi:hypothetical protein